MELDQNLLALLGNFLTPEDITDLKRTAIKVAVIWGLIEWRTRKRFKSLEDVVSEVKLGFTAIKASFGSIEEAFSDMKDTIKDLVKTVEHVELSDTTSTKLLTERLERQALRQLDYEKSLSGLGTRLTIMETKAGILENPPQL